MKLVTAAYCKLLIDIQWKYNSWENSPEGKPRESVDGIRLKLKYNTNFINNKVFKSNKLYFSLTTGYEDTFEYNTVRAEWAVGIKNVPVMIWASKGYNSDLVDYYKNVTSFGIAVEFVTDQLYSLFLIIGQLHCSQNNRIRTGLLP